MGYYLLVCDACGQIDTSANLSIDENEYTYHLEHLPCKKRQVDESELDNKKSIIANNFNGYISSRTLFLSDDWKETKSLLRSFGFKYIKKDINSLCIWNLIFKGIDYIVDNQNNEDDLMYKQYLKFVKHFISHK